MEASEWKVQDMMCLFAAQGYKLVLNKTIKILVISQMFALHG